MARDRDRPPLDRAEAMGREKRDASSADDIACPCAERPCQILASSEGQPDADRLSYDLLGRRIQDCVHTPPTACLSSSRSVGTSPARRWLTTPEAAIRGEIISPPCWISTRTVGDVTCLPMPTFRQAAAKRVWESQENPTNVSVARALSRPGAPFSPARWHAGKSESGWNGQGARPGKGCGRAT